MTGKVTTETSCVRQFCRAKPSDLRNSPVSKSTSVTHSLLSLRYRQICPMFPYLGVLSSSENTDVSSEEYPQNRSTRELQKRLPTSLRKKRSFNRISKPSNSGCRQSSSTEMTLLSLCEFCSSADALRIAMFLAHARFCCRTRFQTLSNSRNSL